jgi:hypothetical protein
MKQATSSFGEVQPVGSEKLTKQQQQQQTSGLQSSLAALNLNKVLRDNTALQPGADEGEVSLRLGTAPAMSVLFHTVQCSHPAHELPVCG